MASALDRRIGVLEVLEKSGETHTLVLRFVAAGSVPEPLKTLSASGKAWQRLADESEESFVDRVSILVPMAPGCARVLVGYGGSVSS